MANANRICAANDCRNPAKTCGFCGKHYQRLQKYGDANHAVTPKAADGEPMRFLMEVAVPCSSDDCLTWPFAKTTHGYGQLWTDHPYRLELAHRVICRIVHGDAPTEKHEVAHSCGNGFSGCVNPRHLRWATRVENMADKIRHGTTFRGNHPNAKLLVSDVISIRAASGTDGEIAVKYGVSRSSINMIRARVSWKWVEA